MQKIATICLGGRRDIIWGLINALIVSAVVYWVNFGEYGVYAAVSKQAIYAVLIGSHLVRVARFVSSWALAHYYIPNTWAVWMGICAAFVVNLGANIILHTIEGTPHPLGTIAAIAGLSFVGLTIAGHVEIKRLRNKHPSSVR